MKKYSRITGTGSYLPPRRVTNADLATELAPVLAQVTAPEALAHE